MIEFKSVSKTYHLKALDVEAVKDVSLRIGDGEIYGIIGYSGAGKSTLVRCINLLEIPDSGTVIVNGKALFEDGKPLPERELRKARREIGMIFQHFNLLDRNTVFDNVAFPLKSSGMDKEDIKERVLELLDIVSLRDKASVYPSQLSGGQKQRVAIARALANNPKVLLSDEATSALDPEATESILALLKRLNRELGLTVVIITHEMSVIKEICSRVAVMENGRVVEEGEVYDIFSSPSHEATKKFVKTSGNMGQVEALLSEDSPLLSLKQGEALVKLTYSKNSTSEALISVASRIFGVDMSILIANVEIIQGQLLGQTVNIMRGESNQIDATLNYFENNGVRAEVLKDARSL